MVNNDNGTTSVKIYFILPVISLLVAITCKRYLMTNEPLACTVMREVLISSKKANDIMLENDPSTPGTFPKIPLQMILDCGAKSWRMPYPYTFKFMDEPIDGEELVHMFLERNKTVSYRDNIDGETALFEKTVTNRAQPVKGLFSAAWECISKSTCSMYFDNSWEKEDIHKIIPEGVYEILSTNKFLSMFLSNSHTLFRTVSAHAENCNSVSLQIVNNKTWEIIPPYIAQKYLRIKRNGGATLVNYIAVNQSKYLQNVPHYRFTVTPGEGFYFPGYYFHIVYNHPGLNAMVSFRQLGNLFEMVKLSPLKSIDTLHHVLVSLFTDKLLPKSVYEPILIKMTEKRQINQFRKQRDYYIDQIYDLNL